MTPEERLDRIERLDKMSVQWAEWQEQHKADVLRQDNALNHLLEVTAKHEQQFGNRDRLSSRSIDHEIRLEKIEPKKDDPPQPGEAA